MAESFRKTEDLDKYLDELYNSKRGAVPFYSNRADYNTNSKSYYDDLSRKAHLFEILAHRIWEYDEELAKRFEEWDKLIESFPEDVKKLLEKWLEDGTLSDIINKEIFKDLNDLIEALSVRMDTAEEEIEFLKRMDYKTRKAVYQRYAMDLALGNDDTPLFPGSNRANQGLGYVKHEGKEYLFTRSRVSGNGWEEGELSRISMFEFTDNGLAVQPTQVSKELRIGHQGIEAYIEEDGSIYLITSVYNNKGYAKIKWNGDKTCQEDVKEFVVIKPDDTPNDRLSIFNHLTPGCDVNGEYVVMACATTFDSPLRYALVYRRNDIECATDYTTVMPLNIFKLTPAPYNNGNVVQDVTVDDNHIYVLTGYNQYSDPIIVSTYGFNGELVAYTKTDLSKNKYTQEDFIGKEIKIEPEGLTIRGKQMLVQCINNERVECCMENHKYVYELYRYRKDRECEPVDSGFQDIEPPSNIHLHSNTNDISLAKGDALQISYYDFPTRKFSDVINYTQQHLLSIYDNRTGASNDQHMVLAGYYKDDEQYAIIRGDTNNAKGGGIDLGTVNNEEGSYVKINAFSKAGTKHGLILAGESGNFRPTLDGVQSLGSAGFKWSELYVNNTMATSDKNLKRNIKDIGFGVDFINKLRPVEYELLNNPEKHYGIIAQELDKTAQDLGIKFDGCKKVKTEQGKEVYVMNYTDLIAPLIKSVQELTAEVNKLKG